MKSILFLIVAFICATTTIAPAVAGEGTAAFSAEERQKIVKLLEEVEIPRSREYANWNRGYDIVFKVLLFIVSGLAAIGAARVATLGATAPPVWLKTSNLALTALVPLITSLAFTQFDFAKRQAVWERRHYALLACQMSLQYSNPVRETFLGAVELILRWGDANSLNELNGSCVVKPVAQGGVGFTPAATAPAAAIAPTELPAFPAGAPSPPRK